MIRINTLFIESDEPWMVVDRRITLELYENCIQLVLSNSGTWDELIDGTKVEIKEIIYSDILKIIINLKPDVPKDFEYSPWNHPDCTKISILYKDKNDVVAYFTSTFETEKQYWALAIQKFFIEKTIIPVLMNPINLKIDFTSLQNSKNQNIVAFKEILNQMESAIISGGDVVIEQKYSDALSEPDMVITLKTSEGLKRFLNYYNLNITSKTI